MNINNSFSNSLLNINNHEKGAKDALGKIASGQKNRLDDVALALIASSLGSEISGLFQGIENANDATSMLQIADGVLSGLSQGAEDLNVLAIKANNPALNSSQQEILQNEAQGIADALQNSVNNASFNGTPLFGRDLNFNLGNSEVSTSLSSIDISSFDIFSQEGISEFVKSIQSNQIEVGSTLNQLSSATSSIYTQITSLSAAKSQIADTDIAKQVMEFNQQSIQLSASLIAQAHSNELSASKVERLLA